MANSYAVECAFSHVNYFCDRFSEQYDWKRNPIYDMSHIVDTIVQMTL